MDRKIKVLREKKKEILRDLERCNIIALKASLADELVAIEREIKIEEKINMEIIKDMLDKVY